MTTDNINPILIDVPMPIRTPRLLLRPLQAGDGADLLAAILETWDGLHEWMPWAEDRSAQTLENKEIYCREQAAKFILREILFLNGYETATGRLVLCTGFHEPNWRARIFSTGYWVRKSAQGQGYATEATNALLRYAFGALGARRIGIDHAAGNEPSRRVIEKLGFAAEGVRRCEMVFNDGRLADSFIYSRIDLNDLLPLDVTWAEHALRNEP